MNDFLELIYYFKNINSLTLEGTNFSLNDEEFKKIKEISENIFIEQLVEEFTLDFIHVLQENAIVMKSETFLRDLAVVIESIKSLIKRDFKQNHPMQTITDALAKISVLPDGKKVTDMNFIKVFVTKPKVEK